MAIALASGPLEQYKILALRICNFVARRSQRINYFTLKNIFFSYNYFL